MIEGNLSSSILDTMCPNHYIPLHTTSSSSSNFSLTLIQPAFQVDALGHTSTPFWSVLSCHLHFLPSSVGSDLRSFDLRSRFKITWVILDLWIRSLFASDLWFWSLIIFSVILIFTVNRRSDHIQSPNNYAYQNYSIFSRHFDYQGNNSNLQKIEYTFDFRWHIFLNL